MPRIATKKYNPNVGAPVAFNQPAGLPPGFIEKTWDHPSTTFDLDHLDRMEEHTNEDGSSAFLVEDTHAFIAQMCSFAGVADVGELPIIIRGYTFRHPKRYLGGRWGYLHFDGTCYWCEARDYPELPRFCIPRDWVHGVRPDELTDSEETASRQLHRVAGLMAI